jgi:hypothetical protein
MLATEDYTSGTRTNKQPKTLKQCDAQHELTISFSKEFSPAGAVVKTASSDTGQAVTAALL